MRLFVALSPPEETRRRLADWTRHLVGEVPGTRCVPARNLHVTLRFLGEVEDDAVADVLGGLENVARRHPALALALLSPGVVPPRGKPRLGYYGLESTGELGRLRAEVAARLEVLLGLETERRPFRPHLTLARCRPAWSRGVAERWTSAEWPHPDRAFEITYVELMESRLSPSGAEYRPVGRFRLEA